MRRDTRISEVDAVFASGNYPIEFLFFYDRPFNTKRLRRGLRRLSPLFWPAFGEYQDGRIVFDGYREAECYDEETIDREFDLRETGEPFSEILRRFALPELERLFFLKVVRFRNGLVLIPKLSHLAGDGYSYFLFLSFLAALTRPSIIPFRAQVLKQTLRPDHRRTAGRDFLFRGAAPKLPLREGPMTVIQEEVPRRDVQAVVREAASSAGLRISGNDVLSALAMKRFVESGAGPGAEGIRLTIPFDVRGKVKEYGRGYFGNALMFHTVALNRADLEKAPIGDIARTIRKSLPLLTRETYLEYLKSLDETISSGRLDALRPYDPEGGCLVTNLSRLPSDRLDFGTGPPQLVMPLTIERNGAAILAKGEDYLLRYAY
jgi:hypothetical protein